MGAVFIPYFANQHKWGMDMGILTRFERMAIAAFCAL